MNARSHVIANAAISPYRKGEIPLARDFVDAIPGNSVTLLDKGFFSADLLLSIQNAPKNRHWMIPERKGTVRAPDACLSCQHSVVGNKITEQFKLWIGDRPDQASR
jgi:hypothetical protein